MSSSSPEPSSSRNTTCFPWRNTVRFPEKPSTFCTFMTPSSRSRPSQCRCSSFGSSLQGEGVGRHEGIRGILNSSSGSSLISRLPKDRGDWNSGSAPWVGWALDSSPEWYSLSFRLFFFFSFSAFLWSSGCRVEIVRYRESKVHIANWLNKEVKLYVARWSLRLACYERTAKAAAVDASCFCLGTPWAAAGDRRLRIRGSSHRCRQCCLCCWEDWSYCEVESPGKGNQWCSAKTRNGPTNRLLTGIGGFLASQNGWKARKC